MKCEDLIKWIKENELEEYDIRIQYRDSGGDYYGTDKEVYLCVDREKEEVIL